MLQKKTRNVFLYVDDIMALIQVTTAVPERLQELSSL